MHPHRIDARVAGFVAVCAVYVRVLRASAVVACRGMLWRVCFAGSLLFVAVRCGFVAVSLGGWPVGRWWLKADPPALISAYSLPRGAVCMHRSLRSGGGSPPRELLVLSFSPSAIVL